MKARFNCLMLVLSGSLSFGTFGVLADLEVSTEVQIRAKGDFHAPLAAHGTWIEFGSHLLQNPPAPPEENPRAKAAGKASPNDRVRRVRVF